MAQRPHFLLNASDNCEGLQTLPQAFIRDAEERPKVAFNDITFGKVPVISLSSERRTITDAIGDACRNWGLFQIVDHGIPRELIAEMRRLCGEFFSLSPTDKASFDMRQGRGRGGFAVGSHLDGEGVIDFREIFTFWTFPESDRDYSRWPPVPPGWRNVVEQYSRAVMEVSVLLLELVSEALGVGQQAIMEACGRIEQKLVVNFYPRCPQPELTLGLKRHTDPGALTVLLQDEYVSGLQVSADDGRTWITVPVVAEAFTVNVGDFVYFLTNGQFKSADHRVVVNSEKSRLSIAAFLNPAQEAAVRPLAGIVKDGQRHVMEMEGLSYSEMYKQKMALDVEKSLPKKVRQVKKVASSK